MNIIAAKLSDQQETIIRDIAHNQIRTLISLSANPNLLNDISYEDRREILSRLIRDFSKLTETPDHLFEIHSHTKALFKHDLFSATFNDKGYKRTDLYPVDEISGLWRKVIIADDFNHTKLN